METNKCPAKSWDIGEMHFPHEAGRREQLKFLLRYSILAPSSHNTQPWKFCIEADDTVVLFMDLNGWLKVADADRREWRISLGCALENLTIAAEYFGFSPRISYFPEVSDDTLAARVHLPPSNSPATRKIRDLFQAIVHRRTNHKAFLPQPIAPQALDLLRHCSDEATISIWLTDDAAIKRNADALIVEADTIEFSNPAFREELGHWIGQGVFGTPWLLSKLGQLAISHLNLGKATAKKDSELLMSSPVFGLIYAEENSPEVQVKAGRIFERIYLTTTWLGISLQPMSQIVQIPEIKAKLAKLLPNMELFPLQPFRLGYAEAEKSHTPRRPLEDFLLNL